MTTPEAPAIEEDLQRALVDLAGLEKEFEKVEVDILRETTLRQAPLFARRNALTSRIRNFWPLTFEQAAAALCFDEYITPEDAHLLGTSLTGIDVTRPDAAEPRTVCIAFSFSENEYHHDAVLTKTFVYQPGGSGLCSEPVVVRWREGKDLTEGVGAAAMKAWEERGRGVKGGREQRRLSALMSKGPRSFFNWFLWTGAHEALGEVHECAEGAHDHGNGHEHEHGGEEGHVEVFPNGEDLAVQIAEDLYPNAPKYFTDAMDDEGDEEDEDEDDIDLEEDSDAPADADALLQQAARKGAGGGGKRNGAGEEDGPAKKKTRK